MYSEHKDFWNAIDDMSDRGFTAQVAFDGAYYVYGLGKSNLFISKLIGRDR